MKKNKIVSGGIGVLVGFLIFILIIDLLSKPNNVPVSLRPIESMETYVFSFVYSMGNLGWVLGSLLLIGYLVLCYFLGNWIRKIMFKN
ncbi:hypothetical protein [Arenibacter latericius]|uniref:hypothetical protein n=1 Tax=Arenibacter latericius TaxID=86104 RepID=UPI0012FC2C25|nr:hypothetical protein [Arenibacter latericius]MDX1365421.1 hypothetical protein [Arenibacter latericius]